MTSLTMPFAKEADSAAAGCRAFVAEQLRAGTLRLPVLPKVAGQVMTMTADPHTQLSSLSALIHRDQALASHVLRIANSAAYAGSEPFVSLQQAVTRLGMKLLSEVALALTLQGGTFQVPAFQNEIKRMWRHALATATWAKEVARLKRQNVEGQFLCGLLHAVGKPVALQSIATWQETEKMQLEAATVALLVEDLHCGIGALVAQHWKLPQQVQMVCSYYRRYAEATTFQVETATTYLSARLADWVIAEGASTALLADPVLVALNIYPDDFESLLAKKDAVVTSVNAMEF